jgi:23S rRNA (adenine2503-C2)-methyltransferase
MDLSRLKEVLKNEPKFRYKQVYEAVYKRFVSSWQEAGNIPKNLVEKLEEECPLDIKADILESRDKKTIKAAIYFNSDVIETVLMRRKKRNTVCVSTQVGCHMGCDFCATGRQGLTRNLSYLEIVQQVLLFSRYLKDKEERVTNVVFMGMGEPMSNYEEVMKAVRFLNDPDFFNIGARKISISTVGIIEGIKKLAKEDLQVNLAMSLNGAGDALRSSLMPINNRYNISKTLDALAYYIEKTNREVMLEYVMLAGVNDSPSQAHKLADLAKDKLGKHFKVNLIEFNPTQGYKGSSPQQINNFREALEGKGVKVIQRYKFGRDIKAACGQLAGRRKKS